MFNNSWIYKVKVQFKYNPPYLFPYAISERAWAGVRATSSLIPQDKFPVKCRQEYETKPQGKKKWTVCKFDYLINFKVDSLLKINIPCRKNRSPIELIDIRSLNISNFSCLLISNDFQTLYSWLFTFCNSKQPHDHIIKAYCNQSSNWYEIFCFYFDT